MCLLRKCPPMGSSWCALKISCFKGIALMGIATLPSILRRESLSLAQGIPPSLNPSSDSAPIFCRYLLSIASSCCALRITSTIGSPRSREYAVSSCIIARIARCDTESSRSLVSLLLWYSSCGILPGGSSPRYPVVPGLRCCALPQLRASPFQGHPVHHPSCLAP